MPRVVAVSGSQVEIESLHCRDRCTQREFGNMSSGDEFRHGNGRAGESELLWMADDVEFTRGEKSSGQGYVKEGRRCPLFPLHSTTKGAGCYSST